MAKPRPTYAFFLGISIFTLLIAPSRKKKTPGAKTQEYLVVSDEQTLFKRMRGEIPEQTMPGSIGKSMIDDEVCGRSSPTYVPCPAPSARA